MNRLIEWCDEWTLGIASIDAQHRAIVELINRLADEVMIRTTGSNREIVSDLLEQLYEHTRAHFRHEERLMEQLGAADAAAHAHEHRMLLAELKVFIKQLRAGRSFFDREVLTELRSWLLPHIIHGDPVLSRLK